MPALHRSLENWPVARGTGGIRYGMLPPLVTLIQQFGRDVVLGAPGAVKGAQREFRGLSDPYVDKRLYWIGRGGEWQLDAADHRRYDEMTPHERAGLKALQQAGKVGRYNDRRLDHRRPWIGAVYAPLQPGGLFAALERESGAPEDQG
jgi:hypothetical protein